MSEEQNQEIVNIKNKRVRITVYHPPNFNYKGEVRLILANYVLLKDEIKERLVYIASDNIAQIEVLEDG